MAIVMQNSLMIQQLQLMVELRQKEVEEEESREESRRQKEEETRVEEEKQNKLKKEEIRVMRSWNEEKSQQYMERFRGYRGDTRCRKYRWFGHMAHLLATSHEQQQCWTRRDLERGLGEGCHEPPVQTID